MKKKRKKGQGWIDFLLVMIFLAGVAVVAYPTFSDYWNSFHQSRAIASYTATVAALDSETYEEIWNEANRYNKALTLKPNQWATTPEEEEDYNAQLNVSGNGNMGYISIPRINVMLPIYHGTDESVLQTSVGHIEGTSLPVGSPHEDEENFQAVSFASHCAISGHRGLPSARLFSDLDKMEIGDIFTLSILNQTLTYEVDAINVVEPEDSSLIGLVPGQDLVTLITCTPYGINTHRLLVRGQRIENEKTRIKVYVTSDTARIDIIYTALFIAVPILLLLALCAMIRPGRQNTAPYSRYQEKDKHE